MALSKKGKALVLELHQIIQADRMAMDLINGARDTQKSIENRTQEEQKQILLEARKKKQEMETRVQEEQRAALAQRKEEAQKAYAHQRRRIDAEMEQNRDTWVEDITAHILQS